MTAYANAGHVGGVVTFDMDCKDKGQRCELDEDYYFLVDDNARSLNIRFRFRFRFISPVTDNNKVQYNT